MFSMPLIAASPQVGAGMMAGGGGFDLGGMLGKANPYLQVASVGLAGLGGIMGGKAQKKANRVNEARYRQILNLLQSQGSAAKQEIAMQEGQARAGMKSGLLQRGVTGSSAYDAAMNDSREREQRQRTAIDESVSSRIAGLMESRTDTAGANPLTGFAQLAGGLGQYGANLDFQRKMLAMLQNTNSNPAVMAKILGG
jgi:hypothetical protein